MIAPTTSQLKTLKLLAAGVELRPITDGRCQLVLHRIVVGMTRAKNVGRLVDAGWLHFVASDNRYYLTDAGRQRAEVKTFVRAFSENA